MPFDILQKIFTYLYKKEGYQNTAFLYNLRIILNESAIEDTEGTLFLKEIINQMLDNKLHFHEVLASIAAVQGDELIDALTLSDISNDEIKFIIKFVEEKSSVATLTKELVNLSDSIYQVINNQEISSLKLKEKFAELTSKMFQVATQVEKSTSYRTQTLTSKTIDAVIDNLKHYYTAQRLIFPLGLEKFDTYLTGLQSSRLYTMVMKSGEGKSTVMIDFSRRVYEYVKKEFNNLKSQFEGYIPTVYYFTFENELEESAERLFSNIAQVPVTDSLSLDAVKQKLMEEFGDDRVAYEMYYSGSFTTSVYDIITYLESEKIKGKIPVAIFVDYLGIMRPTEKTDQKRLQLEHITADLKNLAVYYKVPVLTGVQVKKDSFAGDLEISDIKESSGIIDNSDVIVLMWRENTEPINGKDGFYKYIASIGKQRHGIAQVKFPIYINFPIYRLFDTADIVAQGEKISNALDTSDSSSTQPSNDLRSLL